MAPAVVLESPRCALCGDRAAATLYRGIPDQFGHGPHRFDVARCCTCGLVRTQPRPDRGTIGTYYPPEYDPYAADADEGGAQPLHRRLARRLRELPYRLRHGPPLEVRPPPDGRGRMLDIGAGAGLTLSRYSRAGWEVWGIEPSPEGASVAIRTAGVPPERMIQVTAEEATLRPDRFDLIRLTHVIEHLYDPRRVVANARRWLRSGGRMIVICPNFDSRERRLFGRRWMPLEVPRHLNHFTPDTLQALLRSEGLAVTSIRPNLDFITLPSSVLGALGGFSRRRFSRIIYPPLYYGLMPLTCFARALDMASMEVVAEAASA